MLPFCNSRLLYFLLLFAPSAMAWDFDCGCPETCTPAVLAEVTSSGLGCGSRISWMMGMHGDSLEAACGMASKDPNLTDDTNGSRPCRAGACDPKVCKKATDPTPPPVPSSTNPPAPAPTNPPAPAPVTSPATTASNLEVTTPAATSSSDTTTTASKPTTTASTFEDIDPNDQHEATHMAKKEDYSKGRRIPKQNFLYEIIVLFLIFSPSALAIYIGKQQRNGGALQRDNSDPKPRRRILRSRNNYSPV